MLPSPTSHTYLKVTCYLAFFRAVSTGIKRRIKVHKARSSSCLSCWFLFSDIILWSLVSPMPWSIVFPRVPSLLLFLWLLECLLSSVSSLFWPFPYGYCQEFRTSSSLLIVEFWRLFFTTHHLMQGFCLREFTLKQRRCGCAVDVDGLVFWSCPESSIIESHQRWSSQHCFSSGGKKHCYQ